jgi:hypothetical protein
MIVSLYSTTQILVLPAGGENVVETQSRVKSGKSL